MVNKKTTYDSLRTATGCDLEIAIRCKVLFKDGYKEANGNVVIGTFYLGLGEEYSFNPSPFFEPAPNERSSCIYNIFS
jgi:hypothetical protein